MDFTVVVDTREKKPLAFNSSAQIEGTVRRSLKAGDYTVEGYEDILAIERKASVAELCANITQSRWPKFIKKLTSVKYRFILCEFDFDDVVRYPEGANIPSALKKKIKVRGPYLLRSLSELQVKHDIHVMFCGDASNVQWAAINIMKRVIEEWPIGE